MHPKDAEGIANSVDPDQTAPLGAVWSGSALFAQTRLSENLGSLWYTLLHPNIPGKKFHPYNMVEYRTWFAGKKSWVIKICDTYKVQSYVTKWWSIVPGNFVNILVISLNIFSEHFS